jgi:hypothetical protein
MMHLAGVHGDTACSGSFVKGNKALYIRKISKSFIVSISKLLFFPIYYKYGSLQVADCENVKGIALGRRAHF